MLGAREVTETESALKGLRDVDVGAFQAEVTLVPLLVQAMNWEHAEFRLLEGHTAGMAGGHGGFATTKLHRHRPCGW